MITRKVKERYALKIVVSESNHVALHHAVSTVGWLGLYQSNNAVSANDYFIDNYPKTMLPN